MMKLNQQVVDREARCYDVRDHTVLRYLNIYLQNIQPSMAEIIENRRQPPSGYCHRLVLSACVRNLGERYVIRVCGQMQRQHPVEVRRCDGVMCDLRWYVLLPKPSFR